MPSAPAGPDGPSLFRPDEEELIAGRRPVEEAFAAERTARRLLIVPQRREALERIVLHATSLRIPIVEVEGGTLTALSGFDGHQGVALVLTSRRYADLDEILARAIERHEAPLILVLDSLEDPQNVGTLLRSAESAGAHGVIFPTRRQAPLSAAAIKASAGATEHLLLAPVDDLAAALADLHIRGLRVVGADAEAPLAAREADLRGPLALVIGSEGHGLSPVVRRRCDLAVRIPLRGRIGSLNAAVAGSILLFEAVAQRDLGAKGTGTPPIDGPVGDSVEAPDEASVDSPAATSATTPLGAAVDAPTPEPDATARAKPRRTPKAQRRSTASPAATAADTPAEAPAHAPASAPAAARADAAADAPAIAPAEAPADAAAEAPAAASPAEPDLLPGERPRTTARRPRRPAGSA